MTLPRSLALSACLALSLGPLEAEVPTGNLFNGKDLAGWTTHLAEAQIAPEAVFHVTADGHLRIEGEPRGYLRTEGVFQDYRLIVEWRWPEKPGNSGVLLHAQGTDRVWPLCVEAQLKSSRAGDIVCIGVGSGGDFHERTAVVSDPEHPYFASKRTQDASENAPGEWNRYEIEAEGSSLRLVVNGVEQNAARELTLSSGAICLQSEGAPIEFRRIELQRLD